MALLSPTGTALPSDFLPTGATRDNYQKHCCYAHQRIFRRRWVQHTGNSGRPKAEGATNPSITRIRVDVANFYSHVKKLCYYFFISTPHTPATSVAETDSQQRPWETLINLFSKDIAYHPRLLTNGFMSVTKITRTKFLEVPIRNKCPNTERILSHLLRAAGVYNRSQW